VISARNILPDEIPLSSQPSSSTESETSTIMSKSVRPHSRDVSF
jgi:hypothetical protein